MSQVMPNSCEKQTCYDNNLNCSISDSECNKEEHYPDTFPSMFVEYCTRNALPPNLFRLITLPRYVRFHPAWWEITKKARKYTNRTNTKTSESEGETSSCEGKNKNDRDTILNLYTMHFIEKLVQEYKEEKLSKIKMMQVMLAEEFHITMPEVRYVEWLPGCDCFALPSTVSLHSSPLYQCGFVIGMDAASMAAVCALQPSRGDVILDVCCAPGMKLNLIADLLKQEEEQEQKEYEEEEEEQENKEQTTNVYDKNRTKEGVNNNYTDNNDGLVVGVDVSLSRMYTCRSIVRKHDAAYQYALENSINKNVNTSNQLRNVALFLADGCTFTLSAALHMLQSRQVECQYTRKCVIHEYSGLTTKEERMLAKLTFANAAKGKEVRKHSTESCCSKRERSTTENAIDNNLNVTQHEQTRVNNSSIHVVYAPQEVQERLVNMLISQNTSAPSNPLPTSSLPTGETKLVNVETELLFDKVLVDAECTHDGSLRHLCTYSAPIHEPRKKSVRLSSSSSSYTDLHFHELEEEEEEEEEEQNEECTGLTSAHRMTHIRTSNTSVAEVDMTKGNINNSHTYSSTPNCEHNIKTRELYEEEEHAEVNVEKTCEEFTTASAGIDSVVSYSSSYFTSDLFTLQFRLLQNGFAQLKVNGTLVYCTCSFAYAQDEYVVLRFIQEYNANTTHNGLKAVLVPPFTTIHKDNSHTDNITRREANGSTNSIIDSGKIELYSQLESRLDDSKDYCEVVSKGAALCWRSEHTYNSEQNRYDEKDNIYAGSRFWPHLFNTSFQYIAKLTKIAI